MWSKHLVLTMIKGDVEEFRGLLKNETEKNLSLHYQNHCAEFDEPDVKRVLSKAEEISRNNVCVSLLHVATATENIEFVKLLIEAGCDVNTGNRSKQTPLHIAILNRVSNSADEIHKSESLIKFLLDHGADVNCGDSSNTTPLHCAAKIHNPSIARMLIAKGAYVNERDNKGLTPLHFAVIAGSISVVELLLDNGANIYSTGFGRETPFTLATQRNDDSSYDVMKLLLERISKCDEASSYTSDALYIASSYCDLRTIKLLLDYGAHITEEKLTNLHRAAINLYVDVIEYFLDHGTDVNARAEKNRTPLHIAADCAHFEGCKLLLSRGANINCIDDNGLTSLYLAIYNSYSNRMTITLRRYIEDNPDKRRDDTVNILLKHIAKLVFLNISVNEMDLELIEQDNKLKCYYKNCIEELEKMKIRKVYEDVSIFDILMKNGMASRYARNEDLIEALESAENQLKHDFPIYYSLLKEDFDKEIKKQRLLKGAAIVLNEIFNFHDAFHSANLKILSYLRDEDIIRINKTEL